MSEQQGWAPDPADQQGRASSPAAQPTTTPADPTTPADLPATTTPPAAPTATGSAAPTATGSGAQTATGPAATTAAEPGVTTAAGLGTPTATGPFATTATGLGTPTAAEPAATAATGPAAMAAFGSAAAPQDHRPQQDVPQAWPTNPAVPVGPAASPASAVPVTGAGDRDPAARAWPGAQHAMPSGQEHRPAVTGPIQTWPASQHPAPQPGQLSATAYTSSLHASGQPHPGPGQPFSAQPGAGQPFSAQPGSVQPGSVQPHSGQPGSGQPFSAQPGSGQPFSAQPGSGQPYSGQAGVGQPGSGQPQVGSGQAYPGSRQDPRVWAATAGAGQDQPHLPTAQLPPHVPHMQRPMQWSQQPQPGSVFVPPPVRRRNRVGLAVAGIVAAVGLSAVSAFGGGLAALELRADPAPKVVSATNSSGSSAGTTTTLADVAALVLPSVVSISTGNAVGSGVVITTDGAILTNNHVVATARGTTVQVTFSTGQSVQAKIIGTEPASDLAVIKVVGGGTYTPLAFGDSSTVKVGDTVLAVGSPLGLDGSVTAGIVSAVGRTIDESEDGQSSAAKITGAIQTDAAINPGNSGGALVNTAGQLVGINTAIATSGETAGNIGVGFAISSNTAKTVSQRLLS